MYFASIFNFHCENYFDHKKTCTSSNSRETAEQFREITVLLGWNNTQDIEGDQRIHVKFLDANIILLIAFLLHTPNTVLFMSALAVCVAMSEILEEL